MAKGKKSDAPQRMRQILDALELLYPTATIQLHFGNPFELLVATILSAQCTDARVNIVTAELFKVLRTPEDFIKVPLEHLETLIFSTGFYKAKAKHLKETSTVLLEKFGGKVPSTMDELLSLPGVGRKTANVILGHCFGIPGIVVDTHVLRLAKRMGFIDSRNAEKVEFALCELVPKDEWVIFTHYMINHGRNTCDAKKPKCGDCTINNLCPKLI